MQPQRHPLARLRDGVQVGARDDVADGERDRPGAEHDGVRRSCVGAPVGRALPTELTAGGRRQLKVASAAVRRVEQDMLANLDTGEQDQMRRLLTACIAALTEPPASAT